MLERIKGALQTEVADFLKEAIKEEMIAQGHVATGNLLNSVEVEVTNAIDLISIDGRFLKYGRFVDTGTRGGGWVPIDVLIQWMRIKKIDLRGKREKEVAYAIRWAIYKKGSPTDGDERKKQFMTRTLDRLENEINTRIINIVDEAMQITFTNMIAKVQKDFNVEFTRAA